MEERGNTAKVLTFEELLELRGSTETLSHFLHKQLKAHLETLRPLLSPRRWLGKYVGVKEAVSGADRVVAELKKRYEQVCGQPFALPPELDEESLARIENRLELYPWEYGHEAQSERETRTITITSPVRWVLTYRSAYSLSQLRQVLASQEERRPDSLRQFLVNALVMDFVLTSSPGIMQLLADLRYEVLREQCPGLGELSLVTIGFSLPSFRPADELVLAATRLSGVSAFIELIDVGAVHSLADPLKLHLEEMLR